MSEESTSVVLRSIHLSLCGEFRCFLPTTRFHDLGHTCTTLLLRVLSWPHPLICKNTACLTPVCAGHPRAPRRRCRATETPSANGPQEACHRSFRAVSHL